MERRHLAGNERQSVQIARRSKARCVTSGDVCRQDAGVPLVKHIFA